MKLRHFFLFHDFVWPVSLTIMCKITELALQLNLLDDGGVAAFGCLPASLVLLDIAWNHIGPGGARDLAPLGESGVRSLCSVGCVF